MCYTCSMSTVASRQLRNRTRSLITRAKNGESIIITVDGQPVAELRAIRETKQWRPKNEVFAAFTQADSGLRTDLRTRNDLLDAESRRSIARRKRGTSVRNGSISQRKQRVSR